MPEIRPPEEGRRREREGGKHANASSRDRPDRERGWQKATRKEFAETVEERRAEPSPIDGRCNTFCSLFWCTKRAYSVRRDFTNGRKFVFCTWIGDECIGTSCQYATCKGFYMLPDGSCAWVKQKRQEMGEEALELAEEPVDEKARKIVTKRLGKRGLEEFY